MKVEEGDVVYMTRIHYLKISAHQLFQYSSTEIIYSIIMLARYLHGNNLIQFLLTDKYTVVYQFSVYKTGSNFNFFYAHIYLIIIHNSFVLA